MSVYTGEVEPFKSLFGAHEQHVNAYKELQAKLAASEGDRESAINSWMETTDDAQAVKVRETIARAQARLREMAEKNVVSEELSEEKKAELATELDALKDKIRAGVTTISKTVELLDSDKDNVLKALEEIGDPSKGKRGRAPGSTGSSLPRASVHIKVTGGKYGENAQPFETFSAAATALSTEVVELLTAFANSAKVELDNVKDVKSPQNFDVQIGDQVYHFATTPKERKTRSDAKAEREVVNAETEAA